MKFRRGLIFISTLLLVLTVGNAANNYYDHSSGVPSTGSQASSSTMRAEFDSVASGFDKLPTLTGNGDETVVINAGGTAMTSKTSAEMRTLLGLVIGTNVQAYDATLQSLSSLGTAADKMPYTTGVDTWAETTITSTARQLLDDNSTAAMLTTLGAAASASAVMDGDAAGGDLTGTYPNPTLAPDSVGTAEIATNGVGTDELTNLSVTEAKLANSSVSGAKLKAVIGSNLFSSVASGATATTDVAISYANTSFVLLRGNGSVDQNFDMYAVNPINYSLHVLGQGSTGSAGSISIPGAGNMRIAVKNNSGSTQSILVFYLILSE